MEHPFIKTSSYATVYSVDMELAIIATMSTLSLTILLANIFTETSVERPPITSLFNQTVEYGQIAKFECRVKGCESDSRLSLKMNVNGEQIVPQYPFSTFNLSSILYAGEYRIDSYCIDSRDEFVVYFWFVVNSQSIENVESIQCTYRLGSIFEESENVYLKVIDPNFWNCPSLLQECVENQTNCTMQHHMNNAQEQKECLVTLLLTSLLLMVAHLLL